MTFVEEGLEVLGGVRMGEQRASQADVTNDLSKGK